MCLVQDQGGMRCCRQTEVEVALSDQRDSDHLSPSVLVAVVERVD